MELQEPDTSKTASYYNLVQGNCEYLTFIKNIAVQRMKMHRDGINTLDAYMQDEKSYEGDDKIMLHFEGLVHLIIQLGYFLYSCKHCGKRPQIQLDDIRVQEIYIRPEDKRFFVVIFYRISDENIEDKFGAELFKSIVEHIEQALYNYIQKWRDKQENNTSNTSPKPENQYFSAFQLFCRQFQRIAQNQNLVEDQFKFFLYLQQTSLFYQYSLLYRIRTCSLLDYIRTNAERFELYKEFEDRQENLLNNYQQEKKRLKGDQQVLRVKQKEIESNLESFFIKINSIDLKSSKNTIRDGSDSFRFSFKLKERQKSSFQKVLTELQEANIVNQQGKNLRRALVELQYLVEFSAQKNSICIKLFLPSIVVNAQNTDFLMFQSNVLTFDAANVSIQLLKPEPQLEKQQQQQKIPQKIVAFKATSTFSSSNTKQSLLQKVLLLMDLTMIASRIYQPEMSSRKYVQGGKQSYQKLNNITKKVSHYTKLFIKCAKKVYNQ